MCNKLYAILHDYEIDSFILVLLQWLTPLWNSAGVPCWEPAPDVTSDVDTRRRLRSADSAMLVVARPYRPPDVQHSVTVPSQWLRHVRGTACRHLSGMHRRWRRFVASWRLYFSGRRLTMTRRSWLYCTDITVVCPRLLTVGDSVILFGFLFKFIRCPCNVFDVIVSP